MNSWNYFLCVPLNNLWRIWFYLEEAASVVVCERLWWFNINWFAVSRISECDRRRIGVPWFEWNFWHRNSRNLSSCYLKLMPISISSGRRWAPATLYGKKLLMWAQVWYGANRQIETLQTLIMLNLSWVQSRKRSVRMIDWCSRIG